MRPRIRTIKPEMRQDERYARLSYPARELFNGLITMADDEGRFRALTSAVLGHVFPYDADAPKKLRDWIGEIRDTGMILFYVVDGVPYGAFRHWKRHQKINRPRPSDLPPPPDDSVVRENSVTEHGGDPERSGSSHDSFSESSLSVHSPTRERAFRSDLDPIPVLSMPTAELRTGALVDRLAWHMLRNDPKARVAPHSERWFADMRLLVCDRGGDEDAFLEVERVIDWCQRDSFWRSNILSPGKLRKQFTQLLLKSTGNATVTPLRRETASDLLRAMDEAAGVA